MAAAAESPLGAAGTPSCRSCFQLCRRDRPYRTISLMPYAQAMASLEIPRSGDSDGLSPSGHLPVPPTIPPLWFCSPEALDLHSGL